MRTSPGVIPDGGSPNGGSPNGVSPNGVSLNGGGPIPSLSKEINFRLYAISNIGNDVRNECNEVSPILMT